MRGAEPVHGHARHLGALSGRNLHVPAPRDLEGRGRAGQRGEINVALYDAPPWLAVL